MNNQSSFLINKSEIVERWDPYFYKPEYHDFRKSLKSIGCVFLKNYIDSWNRGDGPRDGYYSESLDDDRVPFIRVNNLKNHTIDKTNIKFIHRNIHNTKLKRTQVTSGDLIFAISGTKDNLGTLAIIPEDLKEANLNSALVRLDLSQELDKFFLCILFELNFIRKQIDIIGKGAAQNNLNNKEIGSIQIPKLSLAEQRRVIEIYNLAFNIFSNTNRKAKEKLASIDAYLLDKLGIFLPKEDYSFTNRIFLKNFSEIVGEEWDPISISREKFKIEGGIYPNKKLFEIASIQKGQSITSSDVISGSYPVIAGGKTSPYTHNRYNYKDETITVSASGAYSGYIWYHDYPIFASDCSVVKVKDPLVQPLYLAELLKVKQKEI